MVRFAYNVIPMKNKWEPDQDHNLGAPKSSKPFTIQNTPWFKPPSSLHTNFWIMNQFSWFYYVLEIVIVTEF